MARPDREEKLLFCFVFLAAIYILFVHGRVGANEFRSFQRQRQDLFGEMEQKQPAFLPYGGFELYSEPAENSVRS